MMAHDASQWVGGAALGALDENERAEFDQHLRGCQVCQTELAEFIETLARLGAAAAEAPPASLRPSVLAAIGITRQLPPIVRPGSAEQPTERIVASSATTSPVSEAPTAPMELHAPPADVANLNRRRRFTARFLLIAASVVAVALVAVGAIFLANRDGGEQVADMRQCVVTATDRHEAAAVAESVGVSKVTVSQTCGAALVELSSIPPPPAGHTYQLWVMAGEDARSVGTMEPDADGTMPDTIAPLQAGDDSIGVTLEPDGGSPGPTTTPLITVLIA